VSNSSEITPGNSQQAAQANIEVKKGTIIYIKTENQGFYDLELYARQEFTIGRFNRGEDFHKPVVRAFPHLQPGHDAYKRAIEKVKHCWFVRQHYINNTIVNVFIYDAPGRPVFVPFARERIQKYYIL
jgi:hypothetical protein